MRIPILLHNAYNVGIQRRRHVVPWLIIIAAFLAASPAHADTTGILLLAHGQHVMSMNGGHAHMDMPKSVWNQNVSALAHDLDKTIPTEIAFGMAAAPAIQAAVNRLEARGVTSIAAVPLFISSHSPIIGNFKYILGLAPQLPPTTAVKHLDRVKHKAKIAMSSAMDADPIISAVLLDRALSRSQGRPDTTTVVLIAHGPNDDGENRLWLKDLKVHASYLKQHGGFREVNGITRRDDAPPPVKDRALAEFRTRVKTGDDGGRVVVVPVLLSEGGIEDELKEDLQGLSFTFAQPLLPHPRIEDWVRKQALQAR